MSIIKDLAELVKAVTAAKLAEAELRANKTEDKQVEDSYSDGLPKWARAKDHGDIAFWNLEKLNNIETVRRDKGCRMTTSDTSDIFSRRQVFITCEPTLKCEQSSLKLNKGEMKEVEVVIDFVHYRFFANVNDPGSMELIRYIKAL